MDDRIAEATLARHGSLTVVALTTCVPALLVGAAVLDQLGADTPGAIENVWDVIGGVLTGVGLCGTVAGAIMAVHWWRWRSVLRRSAWAHSSVESARCWRPKGGDRIIVRVPDVDPSGVYAVARGTTGWGRAAVEASSDVLVAGHPGHRLVLGIDGGQRLVSVSPARTASTRRYWSSALADPRPAGLPPWRRTR